MAAKSNEPRYYYEDLFVKDYIEIPCGKCEGCKAANAQEWTLRLYLESLYYEKKTMLTLTYDNEHVPINKNTGILTLNPEDVENFMKRLRVDYERWYGQKDIQAYIVGEYGSTTERPHYHLILLNFEAKKTEKFFINEFGDQVYKCDEIAKKIWKNGNVTTCEVNYNTIQYTAGYVMKKLKGPEAEYYVQCGMVPPFARQPKKEPLGKRYFIEHMDEIIENRCVRIKKKSIDSRGILHEEIQEYPPPRYFWKLVEKRNEENWEEIKANRMMRAKEAKKLREAQTTKTNLEQGLDKERQAKRNNLFKRNLKE